MNSEQLFWMAVIVGLNIIAYLVGKHEGRIKAYYTITTVLGNIAPNEMEIIRKKIDNTDPIEYALSFTRKDAANKEKADHD